MLGLSQKMYIEKVLKRFSIENSKRDLLPFRHDINLSKKMCPSTPEEIECMSKIPYASINFKLADTFLYKSKDKFIILTINQ